MAVWRWRGGAINSNIHISEFLLGLIVSVCQLRSGQRVLYIYNLTMLAPTFLAFTQLHSVTQLLLHQCNYVLLAHEGANPVPTTPDVLVITLSILCSFSFFHQVFLLRDQCSFFFSPSFSANIFLLFFPSLILSLFCPQLWFSQLSAVPQCR